MRAVRWMMNNIGKKKERSGIPLTERSQSEPVISVPTDHKEHVVLAPTEGKKISSAEDLLKQLVTDEKLHKLVQTFCEREFSHQNLHLYDEIQRFKKTGDRQIATSICENYLKSTTKLNLYLSPMILQDMINKCEKDGEIPTYVFDKAEAAVSENMMDILARFRKSPLYVQYVFNDQIEETKDSSSSGWFTPRGTPRTPRTQGASPMRARTLSLISFRK